MKCRYLMLLVGLGLAASLLAPSGALAQSAPNLGAAGSFGILAGTAVTCTSSDVIGNVGVWPGTAVTRTSCPITGGIVEAGTPAAEAAKEAFLTAYNALAGPAGSYPCTGDLDPAYTDAALTLTGPGVWCSDAQVVFTRTTLTLNGSGPWIFKIGTEMNPGFPGYLTGTNFTVTMSGGSPCDVYWWVDAGVTMTDSNFRGTILGGAAITSTRGTFGGNALAKGAVTLTGANLGGCVDDDTPPGPGDPPTGQHFLVDHFQCYEVKPEDKVKYHKVVLQDQFGKSTVTLKRPWLICAPTVKDPDPKKVVGKFPDDLINPVDHLVCYDLSKGGHDKGDYDKGDDKGDYYKKGHYGKDKDGIDVMVDNQFGEQRLKVKQPQMLCVPSLKTVLSDDDDDDDGCGGHHYHGRR